ncbi:MAG TPA: 2-oxoacid:acceptor oxidoreductase subunit alpha [Candidatus Bathyarchaeia archaeon]|nr:2-oxoacid:acceptor oxidoreductase subunit alpha [Candidatus Bathyarchaeia archaeon]
MVYKVVPGTHFWQGNEACAEGAIAAGCRFYAGYPITPASEIFEHMAVRLPKVGGIEVQMEDEMASLGAVIGASWAGTKAMTATSGPGFSLMQEMIGYAFMTETPCVIVDVQRAGPCTGQATKVGQGDVMQARWGIHGDYAPVVLASNSVQELFDLTVRAFNLAETFRTPVILLSDEIISHMHESLIVPAEGQIEVIDRKRPKKEDTAFFMLPDVAPMPSVGEGFSVAVTGSTHDETGRRFTADQAVHQRLVKTLTGKIMNNADKLVDFEAYNIDDCDVGVVSFGCTSRAVYETVELAKEEGVKVGFVRLKTVWPFPEKVVRDMAKKVKAIVVPELNMRELFYEVERVVQGAAPVLSVNKVGGGEMITPEELLAEVLRSVK